MKETLDIAVSSFEKWVTQLDVKFYSFLDNFSVVLLSTNRKYFI